MRPLSASVIARNSLPFITARSFLSAAAQAPRSSTKPSAHSQDLYRFWNSAARLVSTGCGCRGFYPRVPAVQPTKEAVTCKRGLTNLRPLAGRGLQNVLASVTRCHVVPGREWCRLPIVRYCDRPVPTQADSDPPRRTPGRCQG